MEQKKVLASMAAIVLMGWSAGAVAQTGTAPSPPASQSPSYQAPAQPSSGAPQSGATEPREVEGKIQSVAKSGKSVILDDGTTLTIPDSLKSKRSRLKKGAMVKATYEDQGSEHVATSIEVQRGKNKSKS